MPAFSQARLKRRKAASTYTRGYKGPAFNNTVSALAAIRIDPEIPIAYEAGIKSSWFANRLILDIAAFHETFRNYQATTFDPTILSVVLQNAGGVQTKGVEVEMSARPARGLTLTSALTYDDAYYTDFRGVPCYLRQPGCAANNTIDVSGQQLVTAPRWAGTISLQGEQPISAHRRVMLELSGYYRSGFNFTPNQDPNTHSPGLATVDASVGLANDSWRLMLSARNLLDKRIVSLSKASPTGQTDYNNFYNIDSFRRIALSASVAF
jgi:iron complex outermembrane receptor protein